MTIKISKEKLQKLAGRAYSIGEDYPTESDTKISDKANKRLDEAIESVLEESN